MYFECPHKGVNFITKIEDLSGKTFGLLQVIEQAHNVIHRNAFWKCRCSCGSEVYVSGTNLRQGYTTNCGCDKAKPSEVA